MTRKKVLIIDDEPDLCKVMKLNLESTGEFEVATAVSGEEGLGRVKEEEFDLLITDFQMPGMNGIEVVEKVKKLKPRLPVLLFSIYHDDDVTISPAVKSRADGVISKPFNHEQLYRANKKALSKAGEGGV